MKTALLKLLQVPQLGAQKIGRLLAEVDFSAFCTYDKSQLRQIGWNEKQITRWFHPEMKWIEQALAWETAPHQRLLTLFDADYPFLLRQISTAPPVLFVQGAVETLALPQIAIVGSRDYSPYGEFWAGHFAAELVKHQFAITSGLAIGIDGFCHQRTLAEGGKTIAVLGSGLAQIYPARHKGLAQKIVENGGALVSEFFPHQPPVAENFPRRNRIISGLSLGTLVVEASLNSGSLITARYALEQGREVFAVPNGIQNSDSQGCHKLIKEGALLVETVQDILDAVALQYQPISLQPSLFTPAQATSSQPKQAVKNEQHFAKINVNLTACQANMMAHIGLDPLCVDDLAKACEMPVETLLIELLNLELQGVIKQVSGGYVLVS